MASANSLPLLALLLLLLPVTSPTFLRPLTTVLGRLLYRRLLGPIAPAFLFLVAGVVVVYMRYEDLGDLSGVMRDPQVFGKRDILLLGRSLADLTLAAAGAVGQLIAWRMFSLAKAASQGTAAGGPPAAPSSAQPSSTNAIPSSTPASTAAPSTPSAAARAGSSAGRPTPLAAHATPLPASPAPSASPTTSAGGDTPLVASLSSLSGRGGAGSVSAETPPPLSPSPWHVVGAGLVSPAELAASAGMPRPKTASRVVGGGVGEEGGGQSLFGGGQSAAAAAAAAAAGQYGFLAAPAGAYEGMVIGGGAGDPGLRRRQVGETG